MTAPPPRIFVYGTLMPGERNDHIAAQGAFTAQPATLRGFTLYHLSPEAYPALVPGPAAAQVQGHALTYATGAWETTLPFLDDLEGLHDQPPLYTRERVNLTVEGGARVPAWVYVYARPERLTQPGATPVPGGDWRAVLGRDRPAPGEK